MGSGTAAIAAIRSGRHYLGCELDPTYYDTLTKRVENEKNNPILF